MKKVGLILVALTVITGITAFILFKSTTNNSKTILIPIQAKDTVKVEQNPWVVYSSVPPEDTANVIKVEYDQKYGRSILLYCTAVFENAKENKYRCVAPWLEKQDIEKANINDFKITKVPKKEMKSEN